MSVTTLLMLTLAAVPDSVAVESLWLTDMDDAAVVYKNVPGIDINAATRRLLLEHMPGHQDNVTIVNNERAFQILKSNQLACTGNKVRNAEREAFAAFTQLPQLIFPGLRLYMLQATADKAGLNHGAENDIMQSLTDLSVKLPHARIGIVGGRNYGEPLQQLFEQLASRNRIYTRTASDMTAAALLDMLINGRIELIVEYPNVVQHYSEALNHAVPLVSVNIREAAEYSAGSAHPGWRSAHRERAVRDRGPGHVPARRALTCRRSARRATGARPRPCPRSGNRTARARRPGRDRRTPRRWRHRTTSAGWRTCWARRRRCCRACRRKRRASSTRTTRSARWRTGIS